METRENKKDFKTVFFYSFGKMLTNTLEVVLDGFENKPEKGIMENLLKEPSDKQLFEQTIEELQNKQDGNNSKKITLNNYDVEISL